MCQQTCQAQQLPTRKRAPSSRAPSPVSAIAACAAVCDCAPLSCHWTTTVPPQTTDTHTLLVISINSVAKPEAIECSLHFHVTHVTVVLIENDWNLINHGYDIGYFKFRRGFVTIVRVRLLHRKFEFSTIQYGFILLLYTVFNSYFKRFCIILHLHLPRNPQLS